MNISADDVLVMKKPHPGCGSDRMRVIRSGADLKLCCAGCGRIVMIPRAKCEKNVKELLKHGETNAG